MSSPRSHSTDPEDQHTDPYFDAQEDDENEDEDPDYDEDEGDDDEEEDERDEDDMTHDLFGEEDEFHDAEEGNLGFIVQIGGVGEGQGGEASEGAAGDTYAVERRVINLIANVGRRVGIVSQREILNLLRGRQGITSLLGDDDADDDDGGRWGTRLRRRPRPDKTRFPKVPSDKGRELMNSGTFGAIDVSSPLRKKKQLARRILDREMGIGDRSYRRMNQGVMAQVRFGA
ncbi:hypothetical protein O1611_g10355 [Lasiodiplodia mahajangana]|uniref:Uncharacterized protein n=1 Tax=Lasiodiplodia mahajangana TaxID=1108764 RepID=A0ACC2IZ49_9PEZI|nr:hypothetical protein O1611_g10355 [Lasiodiplodia mahajangana]